MSCINTLQKVLKHFNRDDVTTPKELYEEVFAVVNQGNPGKIIQQHYDPDNTVLLVEISPKLANQLLYAVYKSQKLVANYLEPNNYSVDELVNDLLGVLDDRELVVSMRTEIKI